MNVEPVSFQNQLEVNIAMCVTSASPVMIIIVISLHFVVDNRRMDRKLRRIFQYSSLPLVSHCQRIVISVRFIPSLPHIFIPSRPNPGIPEANDRIIG